jgi:hypothetical protein
MLGLVSLVYLCTELAQRRELRSSQLCAPIMSATLPLAFLCVVWPPKSATCPGKRKFRKANYLCEGSAAPVVLLFLLVALIQKNCCRRLVVLLLKTFAE